MKHPKHYDTDTATSQRMSNVKLKRGKAETKLAKALWSAGYRYRLNDKRLPGSPDIAVCRYRIAIFIDGQFWHGYDWKNKKQKLNRNKEYWTEKIEQNIARDIRNNDELFRLGWYVIRFWSRDIERKFDKCFQDVIDTIEILK